MLQIVSTACIVVSGLCAPLSATPPSMGLSMARLSTIDHVVELGMDARGYAGMSVVVGRHGAIAWQRGYGSLSWSAGARGVSAERTIYDVASLTKVIATTTAVMVLYDDGKLHLDDRASRYIPELRTGAARAITIRQLLEHTSGLPAGREIWRGAHSAREARRLILSSRLARRPGARQVYSDLGADILGFVVEAVSGQPLDVFVERRIFRPLGMNSTMFRPPRALRPRIAPTERFSPRGRSLRGEVHDENAWALGGVAGHAGLFATASDLAIFARMMLNGGSYDGVRIVQDSTVARFTTRAVGTRALGWDTCAGGASCGQHMSERAYGHTGFTGTSIWIDPDRDLFVIVLTNRIHERLDGRAPRGAILADVRADIADIAELAVVDDRIVAEMPRRLRADRAIGWRAGEQLPASGRW